MSRHKIDIFGLLTKQAVSFFLLLRCSQTHSHYLWFFFHTRLPWWKIWISNCESFFLFKRLTTHWSQQRNIKKSFQSAKFHAFSLLKIELMFHTILLLFFLIRARWKILSWIFLYALLISLWFSSFLLFVFPFFFVSHSHLMKSSCKI